MSLLNIASRLTANIFSRASAGIFSRFNSTTNHEVQHKDEQVKESNAIVNTVNTLVDANPCRNFAVVQLLGKQWRVTDGDLVLLEGNWPPNIGDRIRLDKVLLAGSRDFSLIGRPLVEPGLVKVIATVIGKNLSHTRTRFRKKRRKQFMRINFVRVEQTTVRINSVEISPNLKASD